MAIEFYQGDTFTLSIPIYGSDGATAAALASTPTGSYAITQTAFDASALIKIAGSFAKDTSGLWTMTVPFINTSVLPVGELFHQAVVIDSGAGGDGTRSTVVAGPITILPALPSSVVGL